MEWNGMELKLQLTNVRSLVLVLVSLFYSGTSYAEITVGPDLLMNPAGKTPLAGLVSLTTDTPSTLSMHITGGGKAWTVEPHLLAVEHEIPLLGLVSGTFYEVTVTTTDNDGNVFNSPFPLTLTTPELPPEFPALIIHTSQPSQMTPGYIFTNTFDRGPLGNRVGDPRPFYTMILDSTGSVIWYSELDTGKNPIWLENGHFLALDKKRRVISEYDLLGRAVREQPIENSGITFHHDFIRTESGSYIALTRNYVTVVDYPTSTTDPLAPTETVIVQDDYPAETASDGRFIRSWPLTDIMQTNRIGYRSLSGPSSKPDNRDWLHTNSVVEDTTDNTLIVSMRHQNAVVKFSKADSDIKWILGAHANWSEEYQPFLLTPMGSLEWPYAQHNVTITPEGTIGLFDNGNDRANPFDSNPRIANANNSSRVVEYAIDEQNRRIWEVWEFDSADRGVRLFNGGQGSAYWSRNTALVTYTGISHLNGVYSEAAGLGNRHTRITEVTRTTPPEPVFDITIYDAQDYPLYSAGGRIAIYRSQKIPRLYADDVIVSQN
jgi:arylsulfate sulfotransferase